MTKKRGAAAHDVDIIVLDPERPIESLLEQTGGTKSGLAEGAKVSRQAVQFAARAGAAIGVSTLSDYAAAAGWELEVRLRRRAARRE